MCVMLGGKERGPEGGACICMCLPCSSVLPSSSSSWYWPCLRSPSSLNKASRSRGCLGGAAGADAAGAAGGGEEGMSCLCVCVEGISLVRLEPKLGDDGNSKAPGPERARAQLNQDVGDGGVCKRIRVFVCT